MLSWFSAQSSGFTVVRAQSGYTKVLMGTVSRENLVSVVSATGQITPKTYVNVGANAMGRVTHFYVNEGDHVKKGQIVATIENVQQQANVAAQQATIAAARTDINSFIAAEKTAEANVAHAKADLEQKKLDYQRAQALFNAQVMSKQDFDAKKAAYDLDVASLAQAQAGLAQARAQTASQRGHLQTQQASLKVNEDALNRTIAVAPFDGIVTNEPIREGEMVVIGIQNAEGSTLMTLADMSVITAEVKVDETDIVNVRNGQPADVTVDALPGKIFKGHVTEVGDQALLRSSGVATSQSTTGVEEAKDFKVVVTLDQPSDESAPRPLLHREDHHREEGQHHRHSHSGAHHARSQTPQRHDDAHVHFHRLRRDQQFAAGRARSRAFSSSPRPMARTASTSCPSPPASPAPPTSKSPAASRPATASSPAPIACCVTSRRTPWSNRTLLWRLRRKTSSSSS